jgi:hypothetical protein
MDLFSMFISSVVSWGVGKILDTMFKCNICGQETDVRIENQQTNNLECKNCHKEILQYTNACDFTINKKDGQIGHAIFAPKDFLWKWECGDGMFDLSENILAIPFSMRIDGLKGRSVLFEVALKNFDTDSIIKTSRAVIYCDKKKSLYDYKIRIHNDSINKQNKGIVAVDARIITEYKDLLFEDRRLIKPWK